jgi:uncharacterized protein (TIGR03085 family)
VGCALAYDLTVTYSLDERLALIELFRSGPPRLSPFAIPGFDEAVNTVEYFVHYEDVRRAVPGWAEREIPAGLADALWKRLKGSRLFLRSAPTGIVFARADLSAPPVIAKNATPSVTVTGPPAELTLWSMGRVTVAQVELSGHEEAVARLSARRQ